MDITITPKFDSNGLIPTVVQDSETGCVLMVAWMNAEAFNLTVETHQVHFWSRSRQELWRKGATSGNTLSLHEMWIDCDADTLLLKVKPAGPACHTGNSTCFYQKLF
jgi:phosphoribosyl-AMP cyclohydrolase